ncbi:MAG TPA: hypothetical protein VE732_08920 [Nitrososphaera sp.]|nr:hypothetical protein [Nitrososphaera sp.]
MDALQRKEAVNRLVVMYNEVEAFLAKVASRSKLLELTVLILSVLTSGSLWLLLSNKVPGTTLWFGAIASTVVSGITLYIKSSGLNRTRVKALSLYQDLGQLIAEVRDAESLQDISYWPKVKQIEGRIADLRYGRQDDT